MGRRRKIYLNSQMEENIKKSLFASSFMGFCELKRGKHGLDNNVPELKVQHRMREQVFKTKA